MIIIGINSIFEHPSVAIIEDPIDAIGSFYSSGLYFLVIENIIIDRGGIHEK